MNYIDLYAHTEFEDSPEQFTGADMDEDLRRAYDYGGGDIERILIMDWHIESLKRIFNGLPASKTC